MRRFKLQLNYRLIDHRVLSKKLFSASDKRINEYFYVFHIYESAKSFSSNRNAINRQTKSSNCKALMRYASMKAGKTLVPEEISRKQMNWIEWQFAEAFSSRLYAFSLAHPQPRINIDIVRAVECGRADVQLWRRTSGGHYQPSLRSGHPLDINWIWHEASIIQQERKTHVIINWRCQKGERKADWSSWRNRAIETRSASRLFFGYFRTNRARINLLIFKTLSCRSPCPMFVLAFGLQLVLCDSHNGQPIRFLPRVRGRIVAPNVERRMTICEDSVGTRCTLHLVRALELVNHHEVSFSRWQSLSERPNYRSRWPFSRVSATN